MSEARSSGGLPVAKAEPAPKREVTTPERAAVGVGFVGLLLVYVVGAVFANFEATDGAVRGGLIGIGVAIGLAAVALAALSAAGRVERGPETPPPGVDPTSPLPLGERLMLPLRSLDRGFARFERVIVVGALLSMVLLYAASVLLRNIGNLPDWLRPVVVFVVRLEQAPPWIEPIVRHLVLVVGLVGASLAAAEHRHIRIEFVTKFLPKLARRVADGVISAVAGVVAVLLVWAATFFVVAVAKDDPIPGLTQFEIGTPVRVAAVFTVVPLALAVIAFRFFLAAAETALSESGGFDEEAALAADIRGADVHDVEHAESAPDAGGAAPAPASDAQGTERITGVGGPPPPVAPPPPPGDDAPEGRP